MVRHQNADGGIEYEGEIGISPGMEESLHTAHNKGYAGDPDIITCEQIGEIGI